MYYDDDLKCSICKNFYQEPVVLPCGETCCKKCVETMYSNSQPGFIICYFCQEVHKIPRHFFPVNKFILKLLREEPKEVFRGKLYEKLKSDVLILKSESASFENNLNYGIDKVKNICSDLISQILLKTENIIKTIRIINDSFIEKIDSYEKECMNSFSDSEKKQDLINFLKELNDFIEEWSETLNKPEINEDEIKKGLNYSKTFKEKIKKKQLNLEKLTFNNRYLKYDENKENVDYKIIGRFYFKTVGLPHLLNMQKIDIKAKLPPDITISNNMKIESLRNGNYVVINGNSSMNTSYLHLFNSKFDLIKTKNLTNTFNNLKLFVINNFLLILSNEREVELYDEFIDLKKSNYFEKNVISVTGTNKSIFFLVNKTRPELNIYDFNLEPVSLIHHRNSITDDFYFPREITQVELHGSKYIFKYNNNISVMDKNSGELINSFEFRCDYFKFDEVSNNLILVDCISKKLIYSSIDGEILSEDDMNVFDFHPYILFDKNFNIVFANLEKSIVYIDFFSD